MSRINNNVSSLIAQRILKQQNSRLTQSMQRLSTGLRINTGRDDPAGLIASERMRVELKGLEAAQTNIGRAINVVAVAESGLGEVTRLVNELERLVDLTANETPLTDEEVEANQLEIDLILDSINRIANSTELQGKKLLNGELGYGTSNIDTTQLADLRIHSARIANGASRTVNIDVLSAAAVAEIAYTGGALASAQTIEIQGNLGSDRLTLASGATISAVADAINTTTGLTGVEATVSLGTMYIRSSDFGAEQYVRVRALSGSQLVDNLNMLEDNGNDAQVMVNGMTASADGLRVRVRTTALTADITLSSAFGTQTAVDSTFQITGGGARFAITPDLDMNSLATLGIDPITTAWLGDRDTGFLYSIGTGEQNSLASKNFDQAQRIVRLVAQQVATLRGLLGSFERNTLQPTLNSLAIQYENVASAESAIRDTDFAEETSNLTRSQILVQSATSMLQIANSSPNNVLALLGG